MQKTDKAFPKDQTKNVYLAGNKMANKSLRITLKRNLTNLKVVFLQFSKPPPYSYMLKEDLRNHRQHCSVVAVNFSQIKPTKPTKMK